MNALSQSPQLLRIHERRWIILGLLCLSLLVVIMGNTAMNVALPTMAADLGATSSEQQWIVDSYALVFAGLLFTMSSIGELIGRKTIMQAGLFLFGAGAFYAGVIADSSAEVIGARIVMGAAGAMIMPATLSILTNVFPKEERARAVAIWAGVAGAGGAIGLLLTGFILEHFNWDIAFLVIVPVVLATLAAGASLIPNSKDPDQGGIDVPGAVLSTAGFVALVYALIEAPHNGWTSTETLSVLGVGLASLAAFTWWELRTAQPMLDIRLFTRPAFGVSSLVLTLVFFTLMAVFFSMIQAFQLVMGYGTFEASLRLAPITIFMIVGAIASPALASKLGKRLLVSVGLLVVAGGVFLLSLLDAQATYAQMLIGMAMLAGGIGLAMSPTTDLLMSAVPRTKAGMGSATNDTTRELGGALGVAVLGSIIATRFTSEVAPAVTGLPPEAQESASASLSGAVMVAQQMGGPAGDALLAAARSAWMDGLSLSMLVGAAIVAVSAIITFVAMPDRAHDDFTEGVLDEEEDEDEEFIPDALAVPEAV